MFQLHTPNFILRDFQASDLPAYHALRDDDKFQRFYPEADRSLEKAQFLLDMFIAQSHEQPRQKYQLAITNLEGELLGSCGLRQEAPGIASMGCELGRRWQKSGAALEAGRVMLKFGFTELALIRIEAQTMLPNKAAIKLCQQLGMQIIHHRPDAHYFKGHSWDEIVLSISREDYFKLEK